MLTPCSLGERDRLIRLHPDFSPLLTDLQLDIAIDGQSAGRIVFKLYNHALPYTAKNFRELATGQHGFGYKKTTFHRVVPGFVAQGGDFTNGDGTGGHSIWGQKYPSMSVPFVPLFGLM